MYRFRFHRGIKACGMDGMAFWNISFSSAMLDSQTASCMLTRCSRESRMPKFRRTLLLKDFCSPSETTSAMDGTNREFSVSIMERATVSSSSASRAIPRIASARSMGAFASHNRSTFFCYMVRERRDDLVRNGLAA